MGWMFRWVHALLLWAAMRFIWLMHLIWVSLLFTVALYNDNSSEWYARVCVSVSGLAHLCMDNAHECASQAPMCACLCCLAGFLFWPTKLSMVASYLKWRGNHLELMPFLTRSYVSMMAENNRCWCNNRTKELKMFTVLKCIILT